MPIVKGDVFWCKEKNEIYVMISKTKYSNGNYIYKQDHGMNCDILLYSIKETDITKIMKNLPIINNKLYFYKGKVITHY